MKTHIVNVSVLNQAIIKTRPLYQWDSGQILKFTDQDIPDGTEAHFSTKYLPQSLLETISGNQVKIPQALMEQQFEITAYITIEGENSETTTKQIRIPIIPRPQPSDYVTEQQQEYVDRELAKKLNNSGWQPDMYLGTDEEGNVVEKEITDEKYAPKVHSHSYDDLENKPFCEIVNETGEVLGSTEINPYMNMNAPIFNYPHDYFVAFELVEGETYFVDWNGKIYQCIAELTDANNNWRTKMVLGNMAMALDEKDSEYDNGLPFCLYYNINDSTNAYNAVAAEAGSYTVRIFTGEIETKKLDIKYLPEHEHNYATPEDVEEALGGIEIPATLPASDVYGWAKQPTKPNYTAEEVGALPATYTPPNQTAEQVGADPAGTAAGAVSSHNVATDSHNDIRLLIEGLTARLNALANSDDTTLDQMAEVVDYIKDNRGLIEQITTGKVSVADIIDNLTTNVSNKPLSAAQGVALKALIDALQTSLTSHSGNSTIHITAEERTKWNSKVSSTELTSAVETALEEAKASGEFKGEKGDKGDKGDTPQKGIDYYTAADKTEMVNMVLSALPTWEGGSY